MFLSTTALPATRYSKMARRIRHTIKALLALISTLWLGIRWS
jgi:hypothetical protein